MLTRIKEKLSKLKNPRILPVIVLVVILVAVASGYLFSVYGGKIVYKFRGESDAKFLAVLTARIDNESAPNSINIRFNHPMDPHQVSHYASLTPPIQGEWTVDEYDSKLVSYKFKEPYKGSVIAVTIKQGLTSLNHRTLLNDYVATFDLSKKTQYEQYSRVKSFSVGELIPLTKPASEVNIYKSNAYTLLEFLIYKMRDKEVRGNKYDGEYINESSAHASYDKVQNVKTDEANNTISLEPGVYYVENDLSKPYFFVVSSFGVAFRQDDQQVVLGAFDLKTGKKLDSSVNIGLYNLEDKVTLLRDFNYQDLKSYSFVYPQKLDAVLGIYNDEVAFVPVELPTSMADIQVYSNLDNDAKIFVYTDRPIYKPGDKIYIRGIVRQDSDALYKIPITGTPVELTIYYENNKQEKVTVKTDEYGIFYTYFTLPLDMKSSYSYISATVQLADETTKRYANAVFEVFNYTKPEFEIKTSVEKSEYLRSDILKFTISGNYFDNKPLIGKEVEYTVYTDNYYEVEKAVYNKNFNITSQGGMCGGGGFGDYFGSEYQKGKVTLDSSGNSILEVKPEDKSILSQKITLVAKVVDANKNEIVSAANTIVHAGELNIFFIPSSDKYVWGEEMVVPFYSEHLNGEKMKNTSFEYSLENYDYTRGSNEKIVISSGSVFTDENGKGVVRFVIPQSAVIGNKQLVLSTKDSQGNTVQNQKFIAILTQKERDEAESSYWSGIAQTYLRITSSQNSFKVNDKVSLSIDSPQELDVLYTLERGRIYESRYLHLNKGTNTLEIDVREELSPSITAVFTFFIDGKYHTEGLALNVPAMHKLLQVDVKSDRATYDPSETAELLITTKDANGLPVSAQLSVGIVDKAIYALRESATPLLHSSFYYFRPRRTNASSSLTWLSLWEGGGGGGGGGGGVGSEADILYWNPILKTDSNGEARIKVPLLGHETIWKVQVIGSTINSDMGQADTEFSVSSQVQGVSTSSQKPILRRRY